jgi:flagellar motor switch protein FliG
MAEAGVEKSAVLLLALGEEEAAEVFKLLTPKEVQKLSKAMAGLGSLSRERIEQVLDEFQAEATSKSALTVDSSGYVRAVLNRAVGTERAAALLERIVQDGNPAAIERLKWMDAKAVAGLIGGEHPQIVASILVHLEREHAAEIVAALPESLRGDVMLRVATLDGIQPQALRELNEVLAKVLSSADGGKRAGLGGVRAAAEILNHLSAAAETAVLEVVREHDGELAQKIVDEMLVFDNLLQVDDRGIQQLLREVQSESLIVALKGASDALREKIFRNMSTRAAEMLREELEAKGPVRLSEVEAEQKEILAVARRLAEEGQISLGGRGGEAYV